VAGGELMYTYLGVGSAANSEKYRITLRLFRDCQTDGPSLQSETVNVGIYLNDQLFQSVFLPLDGVVNTLSLNTAAIPCLVGSVNVCYETANYTATVDLPRTSTGYTLARLGCCRINNIINIGGSSSNIGSTYMAKIPGSIILPGGGNSSPVFNLRDTALVCARKNFNLDFGATDPDGDSLTYSFCDGFTAPNGSSNQPPPQSLSLVPLPYSSPFSGDAPLGSDVGINRVTGQINGVAPAQGQYVVCVCITEWRNGVAISQHRKDFILKVQDCDIIDAQLPASIISCDDFNVFFENQSTSSAITGYLWSFGDGATSTAPFITHTYADTGRYKATLSVTGPAGCNGKDSTEVIVYPGFRPGFRFIGSCFQTPYSFIDTTTTVYGFVNSWRWDFGDVNSTVDVSTQRFPSYQYTAPATVNVKLVVTNSKGCIDSVLTPIAILDKPTITLPFSDTLICSIDTLPLIAIGTGNFSWQPNQFIINANTSTPLVFPKDTTQYIVTLSDAGCINKDTITVNVLDFITVDAGADTSICLSDSITLHPTSAALGYIWTNSSNTQQSTQKNPEVAPTGNTMYYVTANLGKCQDRDSVLIKTIPYPTANAGNDIAICYGSRGQLNASITGTIFRWSPTSTMLNSNSLQPIVGPTTTTQYLLTVSDTLGCPKQVTDAVEVLVRTPVQLFAGNDTAVVINQPLQLSVMSNYDNGITYQWSPSIGLSSSSIANPVGLYSALVNDSIVYTVKGTIPEGCFAEDKITIKVFKTAPDIFVPTAFTPNNDFKNDVLRAVPVGIKQFLYFRMYNRWGQMIFQTTDAQKGWDGNINGLLQTSGTYIFTTEGIDYTGKIIFRKGTTVLIR
jgi:gliding motility-associated-like protein